jgi:hypothetical protein
MAYGIFEAREIVRQANVFLGAAADTANAAARGKLEAEGFTAPEETAGATKVRDASAALAGSEAAPGVQGGFTDGQNTAMDALDDELAGRLRKTRAKLAELDTSSFLLDALNDAVRRAGQSQAALVGRARALLTAMDAEHQDPDTGATVTIAARVDFTPAQRATLENKITAFERSDTSQEGAKGAKMNLTGEKERVVRVLDRWLAKWQQVAKADFSDAERASFGIPHNIHASRGRRGRQRASTPAPGGPSGAGQ